MLGSGQPIVVDGKRVAGRRCRMDARGETLTVPALALPALASNLAVGSNPICTPAPHEGDQ
jgi:hypothetical protein